MTKLKTNFSIGSNDFSTIINCNFVEHVNTFFFLVKNFKKVERIELTLLLPWGTCHPSTEK